MLQRTLDSHIESTPNVLGGKPRIAGRRISVQYIAVQHDRMGRSADEIATEHDLTVADVYAALAYYFDHRQEIEEQMAHDSELIEQLRDEFPSKLAAKRSADPGNGRD